MTTTSSELTISRTGTAYRVSPRVLLGHVSGCPHVLMITGDLYPCITASVSSVAHLLRLTGQGRGGGRGPWLHFTGLINSRENILVLSQRIVHISDIGWTFKAGTGITWPSTTQVNRQMRFNLKGINIPVVKGNILVNSRYKKFKSLVANLHLY